MDIGPLEYVVLGFTDKQFMSEVLPELNAIQEHGLIRVVDLLFVSKADDGNVAVQEISEMREDDLPAYDGLADEIAGLLTTQDIEHLAEAILPPPRRSSSSSSTPGRSGWRKRCARLAAFFSPGEW